MLLPTAMLSTLDETRVALELSCTLLSPLAALSVSEAWVWRCDHIAELWLLLLSWSLCHEHHATLLNSSASHPWLALKRLLLQVWCVH